MNQNFNSNDNRDSIISYYLKPNEKIIKFIDITLSQLVRYIYIAQAGFCIYYLASIMNNALYLLMGFGLVVILTDGIWIATKRNGKEYTWFSISSFIYSTIMITTTWHLVFIKYNYKYHNCPKNANITIFNNALWFEDYFDMCSFLEIMVSVFLITCVLARWILPIKIKFCRNDLSALLISFMINGTDITKFLGYLDENYIIVDLSFVYLILIFYSLSVLQFSFTLTASNKLKKSARTSFANVLFGSEIWALIFILIVQEIPFFVIRLMILVKYKTLAKNYSIYFYVVKNFVLCIFEIYRIIIIFFESRKNIQKIQECYSIYHF